jgi:hypothetical protein
MTLRMLAACEMSGRVRSAFAARGWDAWSADLLPCEIPSYITVSDQDWAITNVDAVDYGNHYQGDVRDLFFWDHPVNEARRSEPYLAGIPADQPWDLIIGFPPCTDLSQAGARFWKQKQEDGRQQAAADFFMEMYNAPGRYVAVENPRGIMSRLFRQPDQIVEPWWFGDPFAKKTCLWLRPGNFQLPLLVKQNEVVPEGRVATGGGSWRTDQANGKTGMNNWEDSQGRARRHILRSLTMPKFAQAMADQWGEYIERQRG